MAKRRQPGKLMKISELHQGKVKQFSSGPVFLINEEEVPKVRIHGVVVHKIMSSQNAEKKFCYLTVDDTSDTIRVKGWESIYSTELFSILETTNLGDMVDILGKVREYEGELYVFPDSITTYQDMDFELHRRALLIEQELEVKEMHLDETLELIPVEENQPINTQNSHESSTDETPANDNQTHSGPLPEKDIKLQIIKAMDTQSDKNSAELIAKRIGRPLDAVKNALKELSVDASEYNLLILQPNPGFYEKMDL